MPLENEQQLLKALKLGNWEDMNVRVFMHYLSVSPEIDDVLRCNIIRRHPGLVWLTVEAVRNLSGQYCTTFSLRKDHFRLVLSALCQIKYRLVATALKEHLSETDIRWISDLHLHLAQLQDQVNRPTYLLFSKLILMLCHGITATAASLILFSWRLNRIMHRWIKRGGVLFGGTP